MALNKTEPKKEIEEIAENTEEKFVDEKELEIAKEEAARSKETFSIQFKKPITYNNVQYDSLEFDFGTLTGDDALNIEEELQSLGRPAIVPAFSGPYLVRMAARACITAKIGDDIFKIMKLSDYNKIRSAARSFLLASE